MGAAGSHVHSSPGPLAPLTPSQGRGVSPVKTTISADMDACTSETSEIISFEADEVAPADGDFIEAEPANAVQERQRHESHRDGSAGPADDCGQISPIGNVDSNDDTEQQPAEDVESPADQEEGNGEAAGPSPKKVVVIHPEDEDIDLIMSVWAAQNPHASKDEVRSHAREVLLNFDFRNAARRVIDHDYRWNAKLDKPGYDLKPIYYGVQEDQKDDITWRLLASLKLPTGFVRVVPETNLPCFNVDGVKDNYNVVVTITFKMPDTGEERQFEIRALEKWIGMNDDCFTRANEALTDLCSEAVEHFKKEEVSWTKNQLTRDGSLVNMRTLAICFYVGLFPRSFYRLQAQSGEWNNEYGRKRHKVVYGEYIEDSSAEVDPSKGDALKLDC